ncbi:hypothetical protein [Nostoc sp.]|uniref:hypothetical protein n=1 Tax=Nostoc sp. TaxID=1180 RepID=UPI002FFBA6E4
MVGFDGDTEGLKIILERIASNDDLGKLTHKEVKVYARCMLAIFEALNIATKLRSEIKLLLFMLSATGINHYHRSFIASRILILLERNAEFKSQEISNEHF